MTSFSNEGKKFMWANKETEAGIVQILEGWVSSELLTFFTKE